MDLPQLLKPEDIRNLTKEEQDTLRSVLSNPLVQRYFRMLFWNAQNDLLMNEVETDEAAQKFLSRFQKFKGVQYICTFILNNFGKGDEA